MDELGWLEGRKAKMNERRVRAGMSKKMNEKYKWGISEGGEK